MSPEHACALENTQALLNQVLTRFAEHLEDDGYPAFTWRFGKSPTIPAPCIYIGQSKTNEEHYPIRKKIYRLAIDPIEDVKPLAQLLAEKEEQDRLDVMKLYGVWLSFSSPGRPLDWSLTKDPITGATLQPKGLHGFLNAVLRIPTYLRDENAAITWVLKNLKQYCICKERYLADKSYRALMADGRSCWSRGGGADWKIEAAE